MGRHLTMWLWDHVTHLLFQDRKSPNHDTLLHDGTSPKQMHVGQCRTLTIAWWDITTPSACMTMLHTYYCRSVRHQTKCLWDHFTHLLLQGGASPNQVSVGPCYTLTIASRCGTRPSACGTMLHTYYCRLVRHQTKCLWDHVTHLLLQVGAAPDQVPVGPCYTHTYYCRSERHQTKCLWDQILHMFSRHSHQSVGTQDHKNRRRQTHTTSVGCRTQCYGRGVAGSDRDYWKYMGRYHCEKMNLQ